MGGNGKDHHFIDAKSAFDAREELRKLTGLPTYDGIWCIPADRDPNNTVTVIEYVGSAMNHTLEKVVSTVSLR